MKPTNELRGRHLRAFFDALSDDAPLERLTIDIEQRQAELWIRPLRADARGRTLSERRVVVKLFGIKAAVVQYKPQDLFVRPSRFRVRQPLVFGDDGALTVEGIRRFTWFTSPHQREVKSLLVAGAPQWLLGNRPASRGTPIRLNLSNSRELSANLVIWCARAWLLALEPMPAARFVREYNSWWRACHRSNLPTPRAERAEARAAALERQQLEAQWRPAPPEQIELRDARDLPPSLVRAVNLWAVQQHKNEAKHRFDGHDRPYLFRVVRWWCEGKEAAVAIDGVNHRPAILDSPEEAWAYHMRFRLAKIGHRWSVVEESLGIPTRPRSVPKGRVPAWLRSWSHGEVYFREPIR